MTTTSETASTPMATSAEAESAAAGDPAARLLEQLQGRDPSELLRELLAQRAATDPRMGLFSALLSRSAPAEVEAEDDGAALRAARAAKLRALIAELSEELAALRQHNDQLAAALGACRLCWGLDAGCPRCDGHGTSGYFVPDRKLFLEWIRPALARLSPGGGEQG